MNILLRIFFFPLILPVTLLYRGILYLHKISTPSRGVEIPVISVGNITTGGTGKTPAVLKILDTLNSSLKAAVVSRGYGRDSEGMMMVDSKSFRDFGDEPVLIKQRYPEVMVIVGEDRLKCARFAQEQGRETVILDDGFQSWELKRDIDIVVLDCVFPFGGGHLLPFGRLREPVKALSRANAVILNRCQMVSGEEIQTIETALKKVNEKLKIFHAREEIDCFMEINGARTVSGDFFKDKKVICFSGIGNPAGFYNLLSRTGAQIIKKYSRRDHHVWTRRELKKFAHEAADENIEIVTTAKDEMRLPSDLKFEGWVMEIKMVIEEDREWVKLINENSKQNTRI